MMGLKPRPRRTKTVTPKERARYRQLYAQLAQADRSLKAAVNEINGYIQRLMVQHEVPPGHAFDMWGDGRAKPKEECEPLPPLS